MDETMKTELGPVTAETLERWLERKKDDPICIAKRAQLDLQDRNRHKINQILLKIVGSNEEYLVLTREEVYALRPFIEILEKINDNPHLFNADYQDIVDELNGMVNRFAEICKCVELYDKLKRRFEGLDW